MSATYPSFVRVLAIEGSVWLFAGYFMMEVVGCAKYPFNTETIPLSVRNELAYMFVKSTPSRLNRFRLGVMMESPPTAPIAFAEKLSIRIINIFGREVLRRDCRGFCCKSASAGFVPLCPRVECGDKVSITSFLSSSGKKLNCAAKSCCLLSEAIRLKQGLIAEWLRNWFWLKYTIPTFAVEVVTPPRIGMKSIPPDRIMIRLPPNRFLTCVSGKSGTINLFNTQYIPKAYTANISNWAKNCPSGTLAIASPGD